MLQAVDGEWCSLLDIDVALDSGDGRDLVPNIDVQGSHLPPEFTQSLKAPFWLQDAEVTPRPVICKSSQVGDLVISHAARPVMLSRLVTLWYTLHAGAAVAAAA